MGVCGLRLWLFWNLHEMCIYVTSTGGTAVLESGTTVPDSSSFELLHFDIGMTMLECGMAVPTSSTNSYFYLLKQSTWVCNKVRHIVFHIKHIKNHSISHVRIKFHSHIWNTYLLFFSFPSLIIPKYPSMLLFWKTKSKNLWLKIAKLNTIKTNKKNTK